MTRPTLLDLYCSAGGAARGYQLAGFRVVGVDNRPQPRYCGDEFIQADALDYLGAADLGDVAAIHASPPCQAYSAARTMTSTQGREHPQLIEQTRAALAGTGRPYVIENVPGAPLAPHVILCGTMFGLATEQYELRRHRLFETSGFFMLTPPCRHNGPVLSVFGTKARDRRRTLGIYGNGGGQQHRPNRYGNKATMAEARRLMGIDWMTSREICQAIPPAYTEYVGRHLLDWL